MSSRGGGSFLTLWSMIRGKPTTFPPAAHRHPWSQIDDKPTMVTQTDITNAVNAIKNGAPAALDTLNEIADRFALEDTEQEAMLAALAARLRIDAAVSYTSAQQAFGRDNLGITGKLNTLVGSVVVGQTAIVAINLGIREVTVALTGAVPGERYQAFCRSYRLATSGAFIAGRPAGYTVLDCACNTSGQIIVSLNAPLLAIGSTYQMNVDIVKVGA